MRRVAVPLVVKLLLIAGCGAAEDDGPPDAAVSMVGPMAASPQRDGDPVAGRAALIEGGYVGCGVPLRIWNQVQGPAPAHLRLPDRAGLNTTMPYNFTAFTTTDGVDVTAPNCLQCHAETLGGELVIGLGSHTTNFTQDAAYFANVACGLASGPAERDACGKFAERMTAIGPYTQVATIGVNPADNLAAALFAHRDAETLAWSSEPILPLPPTVVVPVDVPPWWRMQKKHAMFYVGAGRGDHARIMMTASTLCVDTVAEAESIDAYFPDVRAYLLTLEPPVWPYALDTELAALGEEIFAARCSSCHGTYGEAAAETYPNLLVAIDEVGTDPVLAVGTAQFADIYVEWYNTSFFGDLSQLAPGPGYVAPPLDGIWATAPFLHNGSVPSLAALLDSSLRPRYFRRSYDTSTYDPATVGWPAEVLDAGQGDADPDDRPYIYDTDRLGYGNGGHAFTDGLDASDRAALLEYLKTL